MKALSFLCALGCILIFAQPAQAYSDSHFISSIIKPNQTTRSKPTYTRYASVSFLQIKDDKPVDFKGTLDVKSQCGALGYVIPVSKCTGFMKKSKLCSEDSSMTGVAEAKDYTTGCCDSRIYTVTEDQTCPYNSAKLSNDKCYWDGKDMYRCACDRGRYQYSTIKGETCGASFSSYNANLACMAYEPRTQQNELYFVSCCPSSYSECKTTNHEVGRGNECRVANSLNDLVQAVMNPGLKDNLIHSKFEECPCASHYDTECPTDRVINRNFICKDKNGKIWTQESNCESTCSKTIETNIDSYLYKSSWHCLYRKDGAVIR